MNNRTMPPLHSAGSPALYSHGRRIVDGWISIQRHAQPVQQGELEGYHATPARKTWLPTLSVSRPSLPHAGLATFGLK